MFPHLTWRGIDCSTLLLPQIVLLIIQFENFLKILKIKQDS